MNEMTKLMELTKLVNQLYEALDDAQGHLEFIRYGDSYEREAAFESKLPERISQAIENFKEIFGEPKKVKKESIFRIYRVRRGKVRKDGARLVKSYGCDGEDHYLTYDLIHFNEDTGIAFNGKNNVRKPVNLGPCNGTNCKGKDLGGFLITKE